jgi:3alpha(or 20beta)-hydroxysteroid dehydrogenase
MGRLDGKVAIITGAASGMGEAHARLFVKEGAKVVFTDVQVDKGKAIEKDLGQNALFLEHDVSNENQ